MQRRGQQRLSMENLLFSSPKFLELEADKEGREGKKESEIRRRKAFDILLNFAIIRISFEFLLRTFPDIYYCPRQKMIERILVDVS